MNYQGAANIRFTAWHDFPGGSVFIHVMDRYRQYNKQNYKALNFNFPTLIWVHRAAQRTLTGIKPRRKTALIVFFAFFMMV